MTPTVTELKRCSNCEEFKPRAEFHRCRSKTDGLQTRCKDCHRDIQRDWQRGEASRAIKRRNKYGIEPETVEQMRAEQGDACAICREPFTEVPRVDHCHATKKVRGLLCHLCNAGIGMLGDCPDRVSAAARYLAR
jgi:hypothetical protein